MMNTKIKCLFLFYLLVFVFMPAAFSQDYNRIPTTEGLNQSTDPSVISRALGGVTLSIKNDVSLMFANPAALQTIEGIQASIGGYQRYRINDQTQQWFPMQNYPNFSLLMGGLTDTITIPRVRDSLYNSGSTAKDTVQRQLDKIQPNWKYTKNSSMPLQVFFAVPFSLGKMKLAVGLGTFEYANLDYYYANSNNLNPDIGSYSPAPFNHPLSDANQDAIPVTWFQTIQKREGSIYGYGGAVSVAFSDKFSLGVGAILLKGTTNDYSYEVGRGLLIMHQSFFGLYPYPYNTSHVGTSDFNGQEYTVSCVFQGSSVTFGAAVKLPTTITRDYKGILQTDSAGSNSVSTPVSGSDQMKLPWRGSLGIGIALRENVLFNVEYEYLPYSTAQYTAGGISSEPWLDGYKFKAGLEYNPIPWLALRCGYSKQTEVFTPQNTYISSEVITSSVYAIGCGVKYCNVQLNLAYEYSTLSYEDMWITNVNMNSRTLQNIILGLSYTLQ
jgi:opacity protein-like surface antigen